MAYPWGLVTRDYMRLQLELEDAAVYSHESHSELFVKALADGFDRHHEAFHFPSPIPMI